MRVTTVTTAIIPKIAPATINHTRFVRFRNSANSTIVPAAPVWLISGATTFCAVCVCFEAVLSVPEDSVAAVVLRSESGPVILFCSPEYTGSFCFVSSILFLPFGLCSNHRPMRYSRRHILASYCETVTRTALRRAHPSLPCHSPSAASLGPRICTFYWSFLITRHGIYLCKCQLNL